MAKKKELEIQSRILTKSLGSVGYDVTSEGVVSLEPTSAGWSLVPSPGLGAPDHAAVWEGYIDLAGMTQTQDLSLAIQAVDIQESDIVFGQGADLLMIWDIVSDVPIDWEAELSDTGVTGRRAPFPGQKGSNRNMENIVQGRLRCFASNATIVAALVLVQETKWGTNAATASDRLYLSRVVHGGSFTGAPLETQIPPATFAMPGIFFEEADLSHMERLRRSYILQGPFS